MDHLILQISVTSQWIPNDNFTSQMTNLVLLNALDYFDAYKLTSENQSGLIFFGKLNYCS